MTLDTSGFFPGEHPGKDLRKLDPLGEDWKTPQDIITELRRYLSERGTSAFVELRTVPAGCSNTRVGELTHTCDQYLELSQSRERALQEHYRNAVEALRQIQVKCNSMFAIHATAGGDSRLSVEMRQVADFAREALLSIGELQ